MKLSFVEMSFFRGYQQKVRLVFAPGVTIIDGRNGVGKSTIFDAVEFVLTGTISKYEGATASRESVNDYIWWRGHNSTSSDDRYVEVGFIEGEEEIIVRRARFEDPDKATLERLVQKLCDPSLAPSTPLEQLCSAAIIRDEHIADLSMDLKETDRYALMRGALGAIDSESWIEKGSQVVALAKRRIALAQDAVTTANANVAATARRLDEVRASIVEDSAIAEAASRLQRFANTNAPAEQLASVVRERIGSALTEVAQLERVVNEWQQLSEQRLQLEKIDAALAIATKEQKTLAEQVAVLPPVSEWSASTLASKARAVIDLVSLGRQVGLHDSKCPLCASAQSHDQFQAGMKSMEEVASHLDHEAAQAAAQEHLRTTAEFELDRAIQKVDTLRTARESNTASIADYDARRLTLGLKEDEVPDSIKLRSLELRRDVESAQADLRILDTLRLSADLERATRANEDSKNRLVLAQEQFGKARKLEFTSQGLHDAARRASSETLDQRLERVLPLMSELYRRLRPHPVWSDIEYSIRGDVRRFMRLQVGGDLNPQFLFSSGQRRATGIAFLLSVNLSLAWSRWRTIMLDDPVQHVDDFRAVHLAELLAQLVAEGRQVICAVEDAALADLLGRRLPVANKTSSKRITLGTDSDGSLVVCNQMNMLMLPSNSLVDRSDQLAAS